MIMLCKQYFYTKGVGLNVSNQYPTVCLNKILKENDLPEWTIEEFIGRFMNQFEANLKLLGKSEFLDEVQKNWIHQ